ncbi:MAG TPA: hypothetical protein VFA20_00355 [Myxococcaceae bacterium]|nr:hypothetical protein [Myxococcaceae bacterium]
MDPFQIFGLQIAMSFLTWGLLARWYVAPRLAAQPWPDALAPLLFVHAFRYVGLVFLVPTVVKSPLPPAFANPTAYGDLIASALAFAALFAVRARSRAAIPLAWIANVVGAADLINAYYRGITLRPDVGAAYYIPAFIVPALFVTHAMMFIMLVTRRPTPA